MQTKTMKQMKHLALALTLAGSGLTLTSCLSGDSDPYNYVDGLVKVNNMYGTVFFRTPGNTMTITPTTSSVNAIEANNSGFTFSSVTGQIGIIGYRWNPDEGTAEVSDTEVQGVDLYYFLPLDAPVLGVRGDYVGSASDSVATHPVISLAPQMNGYSYPPYFFDDTKQDVIVMVDYFLPFYTTATSYSLSLVHYPEDLATVSAEAEGTLRLYLNYRVNGVEGSFTSSYQSMDNNMSYSYYYKAFRLSSLNTLTSDPSSYSKVVIVAKENSLNTNLNDAQTEEVEYTVMTYNDFINRSN